MPAYHSAFPKDAASVCGLAVLPLKCKARGPAANIDSSATEEDQVDEALRLFRANVLFRNFEVQGSADRTLIYLTLLIHQFIKKVEKVGSRAEAERILVPLASSLHVGQGEPGWPLGAFLSQPKSASEADTLKALMRQLREALVPRLLDRIYSGPDGGPNKHWMAFSKRKFLNKEFS